jgi:hypothetical protein
LGTADDLVLFAGQPLSAGDYLHSERELYRIERLLGKRVLVEDCRSGELIEFGPEQLLTLKPVVRTEQASAALV